MRMFTKLLMALPVAALLAACAGDPAASYNKPGFVTEVADGRLWVFVADSKDYADFKKNGEPAKMVTRIGAGPNGMTMKSSDAKVLDDYMAAK
jgi:hypothetical protein